VGDPPALTTSGQQVREAIEVETDERAQRTFDALDDDAASDLLERLRRLPGDTG
jgi:hypothetical protein